MNYILIVVVLLAAGIGVYYYIKNKQNQELEETIEMDDKTYTLERMTAFVKQRLNEITKVNLYDIGLSEDIVPLSLKLAPYMRNQLSLLRISKMLDIKGEQA